jgi:hypothetical protein
VRAASRGPCARRSGRGAAAQRGSRGRARRALPWGSAAVRPDCPHEVVARGVARGRGGNAAGLFGCGAASISSGHGAARRWVEASGPSSAAAALVCLGPLDACGGRPEPPCAVPPSKETLAPPPTKGVPAFSMDGSGALLLPPTFLRSCGAMALKLARGADHATP